MAECDGLEDLPCARTIGNANRLSLGLHGRVDDKLQDQASSGAAWRGLGKTRLRIIAMELIV